MKRALAVVAAVLSTLPLWSPPAAAGDHAVRLRVATYNIHAGAGADNVFDLDRTAAAIADLDADVVALQEVDVHWNPRSQWRDLVAELADRLDRDAYFGPIYYTDPDDPSAGGYGNALLSRYPIRAAENHEITRLSTQDPDPVPEPAPGFPEIEIKVHGVPVHVYATHLDYRADPAIRTTQVAEMNQIMADDRHDARILMGDFNVEPDAAELDPLWTNLDDAWRAAGNTDGGATYPTDDPVKRIDYITVSHDITVSGVEVPVPDASDHRPVVADLRISR